jgi:hypothetical protein
MTTHILNRRVHRFVISAGSRYHSLFPSTDDWRS